MLSLLTSLALATTFSVPQQHTLASAVSASSSGDIIEVSEAVTGDVVLVSHDLTIVGVADGAAISAERGGFSALEVGPGAHLTVDALHFVGVHPTPSQRGTAIDVVGGSLTVTDCLFQDLWESGKGGALDLEGAVDVLIENSRFLSNYASVGGGAIDLGDSVNTVVIRTSQFVGNVAGSESGGAIWADVSDLVIEDSSFDGNSAAQSGGAIQLESVRLELRRTTLCSNVADDGGAISLQDGSGVIENALFLDNAADGAGGGVYVQGSGSLDVFHSVFEANDATSQASGIALQGAAPGTTWFTMFLNHPLPAAVSNSVQSTDVLFSGNAVTGQHVGGVLLTSAPDTLATSRGCNVADYALVYGSEGIDVGPASSDLDGTKDDIGLFGGANSSPLIDADGDGHSVSQDCDDAASEVYPGAPEVPGNGIDDDCDGGDACWEDLDGDGYGGAIATVCTQAVQEGGDCDDSDPNRSPGHPELCNGIDDDCQNGVDDSLPQNTWFVDGDGDGYGAGAGTTTCFPAAADEVDSSSDCDDGNELVHPGADEVCNGIDDNCIDGESELVFETYYPDGDVDGYADDSAVPELLCADPGPGHTQLLGDCDDTDLFVNPDASEECDGLDDNCNGEVDEDVTFRDYWPDTDGDGFGDPLGVATYACSAPSDHSSVDTDCNDSDAQDHPGADERCDSVDNDCNGQIDDGLPELPYFPDNDLDGFGDPAGPLVVSCAPPPGNFAPNDFDCDDSNPGLNPDGVEICDGIDNDCNQQIDDDTTEVDWYPDADGDGHGDGGLAPVSSCEEPAGHVQSDDDCDDADALAYPDAAEVVCDGIDQDCDGTDLCDEPTDTGTPPTDPTEPTEPTDPQTSTNTEPSTTETGPGEPREAKDELPPGCGCSQGEGPGAGAMAMVLLLGVRRRRKSVG